MENPDFVLLTHQRSGSHMLMDLLSKHPELRVFGEGLYRENTLKRVSGKLLGCIVHYNQWDAAAKNADLSQAAIIHLKRQPRDVAHSLARNDIDKVLRGDQHRANYRQGQVRPYHGEVDKDAVDRWETKVRQRQEQSERILTGHRVHEVWYESLTGGKQIDSAPEDAMRPLLEFLGVDPNAELTTSFLKVGPPQPETDSIACSPVDE